MKDCCLLLTLALVPFGFLIANESVIELEPGVVHELQVGVEPSHSYLAALPEGYDAAEKWPILVLMDARGRAEIPMELFRGAALERGWIVVSSNQTMSDGDVNTNVVALRYLWHDVNKRFSIDEGRVYMAGFSGLARFLWNVRGLKIPLAGAIGVGAGLPAPEVPGRSVDLPFYGIVGDRDFNWREMQSLRERLDERGVPNRLEVFSGAHGWFVGEETAARALDWLELRTVADVDLEQALASDLAWRDELLASGAEYEAAMLERAITRDYPETVTSSVEHFVNDERLGALRKARLEEIAVETEWVRRSEQAVAIAVAAEAGAGERRRALEMIGARELVEESERNDERGAAAGRRLGQLRAQLDFYVPRLLLDRGEPERALKALELSAAIGDPGPRNRLQRAGVLTRLGRYDEALELLETLVSEDDLPAEVLESEEFTPLRGNARFEALIDLF